MTNETAATGGVMYTDKEELEFESTSAIFVWRALQNFPMADFEENNNNTLFIGKLYTEYTNDMSTIHLTLLPNGE